MSTLSIAPHTMPRRAVSRGPRRAAHGATALRPDATARPEASAAPTRVRLTRRGRALVTLAFLAVLLTGMVPLGGWATATLTGGSPEPVQVVEVQPGDTLYEIAADVAAPGQVREMVYRIQELNSLPGAQISEGQRLAVPRG